MKEYIVDMNNFNNEPLNRSCKHIVMSIFLVAFIFALLNFTAKSYAQEPLFDFEFKGEKAIVTLGEVVMTFSKNDDVLFFQNPNNSKVYVYPMSESIKAGIIGPDVIQFSLAQVWDDYSIFLNQRSRFQPDKPLGVYLGIPYRKEDREGGTYFGVESARLPTHFQPPYGFMEGGVLVVFGVAAGKNVDFGTSINLTTFSIADLLKNNEKRSPRSKWAEIPSILPPARQFISDGGNSIKFIYDAKRGDRISENTEMFFNCGKDYFGKIAEECSIKNWVFERQVLWGSLATLRKWSVEKRQASPPSLDSLIENYQAIEEVVRNVLSRRIANEEAK